MQLSASITPDPADAPGGVVVFDGPTTTDLNNTIDPRNVARRRSRTVDDVDEKTFASVVLEVADTIESDPGPDGRARGRFGPHKVFIAAIRRALRGTEYRDLSSASIDELLVRAHRARRLRLARADLVAAMDPEEVRDSEIVVDRGINASFTSSSPIARATRRSRRIRDITSLHPSGPEAGSTRTASFGITPRRCAATSS